MSDKRTKGCPNEKCKEYKRIKYKAEDKYCKACGSELIFVCRRCWTPLSGDDQNRSICVKCEAKDQDRREKLKKNVKRAAEAALTLAALIPAAFKKEHH